MSQLIDIATRQRTRGPMFTHDSMTISVDAGLALDNKGKPGKRQVTLLSQQQWLQACEQLGTTLDWTVRRANLLIDGIEFSQSLCGQRVRIGSVLLEITSETEPCFRMDEQFEGLTAALTPEWRGGACCRVLEPGTVKKGDSVILQPS